MEYGICVRNIEEARIAEKAGYDFVEAQVVTLLPEEAEAAFEKVLSGYQALSIPVKACNVFLPGDLKIVGEVIDQKRIEKYVATALSRVKKLGADTVVFGSGNARSFSEDQFPREKAEEQIVKFLQTVADYADQTGITIVIEPLNTKESNIINSVAEGVDYVKKVNQSSVQVLADFYHMDEEKEALTEIIEHKDYLKHIHLADTGRFQPGTGQYPYEEFVRCVKEADYNGRVSIESSFENFTTEELKKSLDFLKAQFEGVSVK